MAAWNLYRHCNSDGSSKDWAVITHTDGSVSTRWGKTASRLPGVSTRHGLSRLDIERQKRNKGYVFVAEVAIDHNGNVTHLGQVEPEQAEDCLYRQCTGISIVKHRQKSV